MTYRVLHYNSICDQSERERERERETGRESNGVKLTCESIEQRVGAELTKLHRLHANTHIISCSRLTVAMTTIIIITMTTGSTSLSAAGTDGRLLGLCLHTGHPASTSCSSSSSSSSSSVRCSSCSGGEETSNAAVGSES